MIKKTIFIGQRGIIAPDIGLRLKTAIQNEIAAGCQFFTMNTDGLFVQLALATCRELQQTNPAMQIEVTNAVNRPMIDACDTLICYVRPEPTTDSAYLAMQFAARQGKKIVNLYSAQDETWLQAAKAKHGSLFIQKVFNQCGGIT